MRVPPRRTTGGSAARSARTHAPMDAPSSRLRTRSKSGGGGSRGLTHRRKTWFGSRTAEMRLPCRRGPLLRGTRGKKQAEARRLSAGKRPTPQPATARRQEGGSPAFTHRHKKIGPGFARSGALGARSAPKHVDERPAYGPRASLPPRAGKLQGSHQPRHLVEIVCRHVFRADTNVSVSCRRSQTTTHDVEFDTF